MYSHVNSQEVFNQQGSHVGVEEPAGLPSTHALALSPVSGFGMATSNDAI